MTEAIDTHLRGISLEEAWTRLGIGKTKFFQLLKQSEFETYYIGSRHLVVEASLTGWIERNKSTIHAD